MKKNKKRKFSFRKTSIIFFTLLLIFATLLFGITAISSNYLPIKYSILLVVVLILLNALLFFLLTRKKIVFYIIGQVYFLIIFLLLLIGYKYMDKTFSVLRDILKNVGGVSEYYYIVLDDSSYQEVKELEDKKIGIPETNSENIKNAIEEQINADIEEYDNVGNLLYSLELHEAECVVISATSYELVKETDENLYEATRILDTVDVVDNSSEIESTIETNKSFIIYLSGLDTRDTSSVPEVGLSDVNMLIVVNPKSNNILLVNIPRDYYVQLHGTEGYKDKLTHAGLYGINMSIQTIEDLFNININAYIKVNFNTLTVLVDDIGGIDVYSDISFNSSHLKGWTVPSGTSHMTGEQALAFARERYAYQEGDRHRGQNQQTVITSIINKISSNKSYLLQFDKILSDISPYLSTNISEQDVQELVKYQLDKMPSWEIESISVNGSNSTNYTYSWPKVKSYVMIPDQETLDNAKSSISAILKN